MAAQWRDISQAFAEAVGHHQAGRLQRAQEFYRQIVELEPNHDAAWHLLGVTHSQQSQYLLAAQCIQRAIQLNGGVASYHANLGNVYRGQGQLDEAALSYRRALELQPELAEVHQSLGDVQLDQGKLAEAVASYRRALEHNPDLADACSNLAIALRLQGKLTEAAACCHRALELAPSLAVAHNNLGTVRFLQNRLEEAIACYRRALELKPRFDQAYNNLGLALRELGKLNEAADNFHRAIELKPDSASAHSNLGVVSRERGRHDEAIACCRRAIEIDPNLAVAHGNLAVALQAIGRYEESMVHHRRAVECDPTNAALYGNLLYLLNYDSSNDPASTFAEHRLWGQRHADPLTAGSCPHTNDHSPDRRLRLGYFSGNFMAQAVSFFVEPILASHDHDRFEVFCYSNVSVEDEVTARLRGFADTWRAIKGVSDEHAAEQVRADQIDILVDLDGHIDGNRLLVFARMPAPIQVTYIGYQNTTGMQAMDYRLTDAYADPPGQTEAYYTETLVRLPRSFFCYLPSAYAPPVVPPPALANGYVTFGSFNNITKLRPECLKAWGAILRGVPHSRLIILGDMVESLKSHLIATFATLGIAADRLELAQRRPRQDYLQLIQRADISLDPFPFNGHTTTCDALWQGLPVVARCGSQYASRFGCSGLVTLGLAELVASSADQYVEIAIRLALDLDRLALLRSTLRQRMADSPLLDFAGFTRDLEAAYRQMWLDWCHSHAETF